MLTYLAFTNLTISALTVIILAGTTNWTLAAGFAIGGLAAFSIPLGLDNIVWHLERVQKNQKQPGILGS